MNLESLITQLGVSGALLAVVYRVGMSFVSAWRVTEAQRTEVLERRLSAIVDQVAAHHTADLTAHAALAADVAELSGRIAGVLETGPKRKVSQS